MRDCFCFFGEKRKMEIFAREPTPSHSEKSLIEMIQMEMESGKEGNGRPF